MGTARVALCPRAASFTAMWRVLAVVPGLLCAAASFADPDRADRPKQEAAAAPPLQIIITADRGEGASLEAPDPVTVIEQDRIEDGAPTVLPDALRGETGVYVQQTTAGQGAPIIRGLIGSSVLMLVDGIRLNNAIFRPAPNQYYALVDAQNVSRIEVLRGPGSALYGSDALGGVINVITPTPRFEGERWQQQSRVRSRYASAEDAWLGRYAYSGGRAGFGLNAGLTLQDIGDREAGGDRGRQSPSEYDVEAANFKLLRETDYGEFVGSVQYLRQPKTPRIDELRAGFGQTQPASEEFFFEPNDRLFIHGTYRHRSTLGPLRDIEVHAAFQEINDDRRQRDFGSDIRNLEQNRSQLLGLTAQARSAAGADHLLTYGMELYRDEVASSREQLNLSTGVSSIARSRFADGARIGSYALYLQDEWLVTDRLTLTLDARYSFFDIDIPAADRGVPVDNTLDDLTGGLGLNYALSGDTRLVANIGRGFRIPNVFDFSTLGVRPGNRFNIPNPGLGPEKVLSIDLGVKHASGNLMAELFVFRSRFTDKITDRPTGTSRPDGRIEVQSVNLGEVDLYGLEGGLRYSWDADTEIFANLNLVRAEQDAPDGGSEPASRIPPLNARLGLRRRLSPDWTAQAWLHAADDQDRLSARDIRDPRIDPDGTPGWATLNLALDHALRPNIDLRLAVENILDKGYRFHGSGLDAPGRNFILTLDYRFAGR